MKRTFALIAFFTLVALANAQLPDMRTKLLYNSALCRYEVYVTPSANHPNFVMGGSQIVIAVPHNAIYNYSSLRKDAFVISSVLPTAGSWKVVDAADLDVLPFYNLPFDYYIIDTDGGSSIGTLVANNDVLLFHFTLGGNCINGIRLWEGVGAVPNNFNDPEVINSGDFVTNINYVTTNTETWVGNSANTPTSLPVLSAVFSLVEDDPLEGITKIATVVSGGSACPSYTYAWSGTGIWFFPPGMNSEGYVQSPGNGTYTVTVRDANGCEEIISITLPLLPVELVKYTVSKAENNALLRWTTASEVDNSHYEVEHSTNGTEFVTIGKVLSKSSYSTATQHYDFLHTNTRKGINYYRLKQVDFNGASEYSDVRSVVFDQNSVLSVYPNPVSDILNVVVPGGVEEGSLVEIVNASGKIVRSFRNNKSSGDVFSVNVSDISSGHYIIKIKTNTELFWEQLLIAR
jgi:hypothetical protein